MSTGAGSAAAFTKYSGLHLHATGLGPQANHSCDVIYDLYVPSGASASNQVPAILTTNGFGGSKNDAAASNGGPADLWATRGYEVLSYSGLGFGDTSCPIELDSPEWDGRVASQFVSLLGHRPEVLKDGPDDPRVGTWGGSYGGGFQFALAAVDNRVDAMVPEITWNDLTYSLIPNNYSASLKYDMVAHPGVEKFEWISLFFADGQSEPLLHRGLSGWLDNKNGKPFSGSFNPACPGFDQSACTSYVQGIADGYPNKTTVDLLKHVSAEYEYFQGCHTGHYPPILLAQGETDTLFNMAEAVRNYEDARFCGAPAKLVFKLGGHSGPDAPGEYSTTDPAKGYVTQLETTWFDHYLKNLPVDTGAPVEYFRDWVTYDTKGSAQPAYESSPRWPVGDTQKLYLSSNSKLVSSASQVHTGAVTFIEPAEGSYSETSAVETTNPISSIPLIDPPGTTASFTSAPLPADMESVGIPTADFQLTDLNPVGALNPGLAPTLFGKVYDVDPAGHATLVHRLVTPLRVMDPSQPVHINLPGVAHLYPKGHRIELVIATTDLAYVGSRAPHALRISTSPAHPGVLTMPVVQAAASSLARATAAGKVEALSLGARSALPNTGTLNPASLLPFLAMLALGLGALGGRRARS